MDDSAPRQQPSPPVARDAPVRFEPATLIAGRWRISRQLGAVRLDEMYEATDVGTDETVVLRVIRRDDGRDDATFRRFARVARRLAATRHPNVQRILGLATHELENAGVRERVVLLVTEVLNGETLTHRVRRAGPLEGELAQRFIEEICAGLDAIHRARVLHGDITGTSAVFVEASDGSERVVLTDLAFLSTGEGDDQAMARAVGSPAYRAPEQLTGRKLHRASDIFSLGAVIYEALTARLPFTGGNLLALDFRQLEEEPRHPSELVPGLDTNLERAILRCLSRAPEDRFERAPEILRAIRGEDVATPRFRQTVRTLGGASLLIALMIGGSALLSWVSFLEDRRLGDVRVLRSRPSIAVMPIRSDPMPERDAWIPMAAAELIRLDLSRDDGLRVAPREAVSGAVADLALRDSETLGKESLLLLRSVAGVEQIVVGSCRLSESSGMTIVTLDLCLQDAGTGETVGAAVESGPLSELPELASRIAARVRPIVGAPAAQHGPGAPKLEQWSATGLEAYSNGLASLEMHRADEAVASLRLAATTDAGNPTVRLALSQALWITGDVARAVDEAKRAWDASEGLSPERSMELELRYAKLRGEGARAMEVYRRLIRTYPDRIDHGLGLVDALIGARDFDDARHALRSLRSATSTPFDPRIELVTARLELESGRYAAALAAADEAAELATTIGARAILAEALVERSRASSASGESGAALAALEKAGAVFRERGDLDEVARLGAMRAAIQTQAGMYDAALESLRESERLYTEVGQRQGVAATRASIAVLSASRGRHRDAAQQFATAIDGFAEIGDDANIIRSRLGLAESLRSLGALASAEAQLRAALASPQASVEPFYRGLALLGLARVETERGRLARAKELLDRAAADFESRGFGEGLHEVAIVRGFDTWLSGDDAGARKVLHAAEESARSRRDDISACRAVLTLARIDLLTGDAAVALDAMTGCIDVLAAQPGPTDSTTARALAARAAMRLGNRGRARELLDAIPESAIAADDFAAAAFVEIARESVRAASTSNLLRLAANAADASMTLIEIEALLAAADVASRRGDFPTVASALDRAETRARQRELAAYLRLVERSRAAAPR